MLKDLDPILSRLALDAVIVPMHEMMHASFRWLTRGAKVTRGYAIKLRDREPVLVTYPMERDEAAATGMTVRHAAEFGHESIFRSAATPTEAYAQFFTNVLRALGSGQTIAFFGNAPLQIYIGLAEAMEQHGWRVSRGQIGRAHV